MSETIIAQNVHTQRTVPLSALALEHKNWSNPREFTGLKPEQLDDLGASIKEKGFKDPIKVKRVWKDGSPNHVIDLVTDGQRRIMAAREVLPKDYPVPVVDVDNEPPVELTPEVADRLLVTALTTLEREGLSSYELSNIAWKLKDRGKTLEYIAKIIHRDPSWVSKFLSARKTATPKLMLQWRKGEITDEQFKELATIKEPEKQTEAAKDVAETRKSGDKAEARLKAKEIVEKAKAEGATTKAKPAPVKPTTPTKVQAVVKGPQLSMPGVTADAPAKKPEPKMRNRAVLDDFLHMFDKRPPTSDYVKGIRDAMNYVTGLIEADDFQKAWHQYVNRVEGKPRKKPTKKALAAVKKARAKASKPATKKSTKKGKK